MSPAGAVKEVALQPTLAPAEEPKALALSSPNDNLVLMFERLAKDPGVDVEKLERLIAMQERILAHNAKAAFDAAFSQMQPKIPSIDEKGRIVVEGVVRSTYAKNEDIQDTIRPILAQYGFSLSFETRWPDKGGIEVIGTLAHVEGHSRLSTFKAEADKTGSKNGIQALGSSTSYGRRYTTIDLLNISTRELGRGADDDGQNSEKFKAPAAPDGFDNWWLDMEVVAQKGWDALSAAWNKSKGEFKNHVAKHSKREWEDLKAKAQKVTP